MTTTIIARRRIPNLFLSPLSSLSSASSSSSSSLSFRTTQKSSFFFSTTAATTECSCITLENGRLLLLLPPKQEEESTTISVPRILWPCEAAVTTKTLNLSHNDDDDDVLVEALCQTINDHYNHQDTKMGGMGELDQGVWFLSSNRDEDCPDILSQYSFLIKDVIEETKINRHGVPFGVYTSGIVTQDEDNDNSTLLDSLHLSQLDVSLWASNPNEYLQLTQSNHFGHVCQFIEQASLQNIHVVASISSACASKQQATALAHALGAMETIVR